MCKKLTDAFESLEGGNRQDKGSNQGTFKEASCLAQVFLIEAFKQGSHEIEYRAE